MCLCIWKFGIFSDFQFPNFQGFGLVQHAIDDPCESAHQTFFTSASPLESSIREVEEGRKGGANFFQAWSERTSLRFERFLSLHRLSTCQAHSRWHAHTVSRWQHMQHTEHGTLAAMQQHWWRGQYSPTRVIDFIWYFAKGVKMDLVDVHSQRVWKRV